MADNFLHQTIEQFNNRGLTYLQSLQKNALLQIKDNLTILNQFISSDGNSMALSEWKTVEGIKPPKSQIAPQNIRLGSLQILNSKGEPIKNFEIPLVQTHTHFFLQVRTNIQSSFVQPRGFLFHLCH